MSNNLSKPPRREIVLGRPYVDICFCHPDDSLMSNLVVQREALIDTGASTTCITMAMARSLDLPYQDRRTVQVAGGSVMGKVFLARLFIPELVFGDVCQVIAIQGASDEQTPLLGRNFLKRTIFTMDGPAREFRLSL